MRTGQNKKICPMCSHSGQFTHLTGPLQISYWHCEICQLIFMDRDYLPDVETEEQHYKTHQNGPQYQGYVDFLNQAINPTLPYLDSSMRGLDYGSGPGPTLCLLLKNQGIQCENYDPIFSPDMPDGKFDFIFATEVVEHFFYPAQEFTRISSVLNSGGIFTIMTELWQDLDGFSEWYYAKDPTHVCFYHARTMDYMCKKFGFEILDRKNPRVNVLKNI
jgi:hypothetical protein